MMALARRRALRLAGWFGFAALIGVGEAVRGTSLPPVARQLVLDALTYLLPIALAGVAAFVLALRSYELDRRLWGLIAVMDGLLIVSETYWTWYVAFVDPRGPRLPAPFELLQVGAAVTMLYLLSTMTAFGETPLVTRMRFFTDIAAGMIVGAAGVYWFWTLPLFRSLPYGGLPAAAVAAVYPVTGAILLLATIAMTLGWKAYRWRSWERLVVGFLALYGVGLLAFPSWYSALLAAPAASSEDVFGLVTGFGYYLLFMAMIYRATSEDDTSAAERWPIPRVRPTWLPMAYPVAVALMLPVLGWASLVTGPEPYGGFIIGLTVALAAMLILRSWLSNVERVYLRGLAITDPVTGAYNRRYLYERLAEEFAAPITPGREPALIVFDVDDFRRVNQLHGHERGDAVLRQLAEVVGGHAGSLSAVYRVGSDELALVMTGRTSEEVLGFARRALARIALAELLPDERVGVSVGVAFYPRHGTDVDQLLAHALAAQQLARAVESPDPVVYDDEIVGSVDPVERLARARKRSHRATVQALAAVVDARDPATKHHSENVCELATSLAQVLGLSDDQVRVIELASQMHDVGKIGIRDDVLLKPDALTASERSHVEEHPTLGERILSPAQLDEILPAVRHHHERWDGAGYPDHLWGEDIPVEARILSVCDAFEAMTSTRAYRPPLTLEAALAEVEACAGTQFDPVIAATFVRMVTRLQVPVAASVGPSLPSAVVPEPTP